MKTTDETGPGKKETLKKLREARRQTIENATLRMKAHKKAMDAVREQLKAGARTVPELAESAGLESSEVMWIVAALKKYGEVAEGEKDGSYFRYSLLRTTP